MLPLDSGKYLAEVLKPYATGEKSGLPGPFERYLLEASDSDHAAIAVRLSDVKAIWDKSFEHTRYGEVAKTLSAEHKDRELELLDTAARGRLAERERRAFGAEEEKRKAALVDWRGLLEDHVQSKGGLTPDSHSTLERIAKRQGLDATVVADELAKAPVAAEPDVLDGTTRAQIRKALGDLARLNDEERLALSLFHALGLDGVTDDVSAVRRQLEELNEVNSKQSFGQKRSAMGSVLTLAKMHLLDADPRSYIRGLTLDIGDAMELEVARSASDGVIDAVEAEALLQSAVRHGLTPDIGRQMIADLARSHGASLREGEAVDYVACPACNTPHPRPSAPVSCKRCGTALFIGCPAKGCGARNDGTAMVCSECQTDIFRYSEAIRRLGGLGTALDEGRIAWAGAELTDIVCVLGHDAIPDDLRKRIDDLMSAAEANWAHTESAIADRRLYEARTVLRALAKASGDVAGPSGDRPKDRLLEIDRRIADAEAALAKAQASSGADREAALVAALEVASDSDEAIAALAAIPPEPPEAVEVEMRASGPRLSWRASSTAGARYLVRRIDTGTGQGTDLSSSAATDCEDHDAPSGSVVRYEVATLRGKTRSASVRSPDLLVAREVQGLAVADRDRLVRLSWDPVPSSARVIVRRRCEGTGAERELVADRSGLADRDVENGERYAYAVLVEYAHGGHTHRSAGTTVYGQPALPPEGLDGLRIETVRDGVAIDFDAPSAGTVTIVRCVAEPEIELGENLDPSKLGSIGQILTTGSDGTRDDAASGICWYLPVTVAGGTAVAGRAVRHLALPDIRNVAVADAPGQVRVTWEWPDSVTLASVLWRRDRQPSRPHEPGTDSAWVRLGEYRDNGGFTLENAVPGALFIAVVPAARVDGNLVPASSISKRARAAIRSAEKAELRYAVRRTGMRKKRLEIEVEAPSGTTAPSLVLVARSGDLLPRTASEGEVLARLGGGEPLASSIDLSSRRKPLAIRLFLESASSAALFQLFDPVADDLLIR